MFSEFDAFTGRLLLALYGRRPELFGSINRTLTLGEVLAAPSLEVLKAAVLSDDIEQLRRKSYVEQFASLGSRFDVKLTGFERWGDFVECSQRRNSLTHCEGRVSEQYLAACAAAGRMKESLPDLGDVLRLGPEYFLDACELLIEVVLKLGQTLWRKTLPDELNAADAHLRASLYGALKIRQWKRAEMIGSFGTRLPNVATDSDRRVIRINYAQAIRFGGNAERATKILSEVDWTASAADFRLAETVLNGRFDEAADWMKRIGPNGDMTTEDAYHTWPLFTEFRESTQFADAYLTVFGRPFIRELETAVGKAAAAADVAVREIPAEIPNQGKQTGTVDVPEAGEPPGEQPGDALLDL